MNIEIEMYSIGNDIHNVYVLRRMVWCGDVRWFIILIRSCCDSSNSQLHKNSGHDSEQHRFFLLRFKSDWSSEITTNASTGWYICLSTAKIELGTRRSIWTRQTCAVHAMRISMRILRDLFPGGLLGPRFFLRWRFYLKERVYKPSTLIDIKDAIRMK